MGQRQWGHHLDEFLVGLPAGGKDQPYQGGLRLSFSYRDPSEKRDQILMSLVEALNGDFWSTYETRKIKG